MEPTTETFTPEAINALLGDDASLVIGAIRDDYNTRLISSEEQQLTDYSANLPILFEYMETAIAAALRATAASVVGSGPEQLAGLTADELNMVIYALGRAVDGRHVNSTVGQRMAAAYDKLSAYKKQAALSPSPVATEGAGQPTNDELRKKLARAEQALLDCGEAVGRYEGSGDLVYDNDDYVTDGEGCYLTREEARVLTEDKLPALPQPQKGGQPNA